MTEKANPPKVDVAKADAPKAKVPLYTRLLRLRYVSPRGWQRAMLADGSVAVAVVLVLADVATAWTLLVLPVAVAAVVKAHDVLAGLLGAAPVDHTAAVTKGGTGDPDLAAAQSLERALTEHGSAGS